MNWQEKHKKIIKDFMAELSKEKGYILKGGTALMLCYNLTRFSEDIDLDGMNDNILDIINSFCQKYDYNYRIAKDTDTVKRAMIHYSETSKPLKIEVSYRRKTIPEFAYHKVNDINVYNINELALMKANAFIGRDKIRDLYDITFICNNYYDELDERTIFTIQNAFQEKGIEHFDYIIYQDKDELIDSNELADGFLRAYDKLGLLYTKEEKKLLEEYTKNEEIEF